MTMTPAIQANGHDPETGELLEVSSKLISEMATEAAIAAKQAASAAWNDTNDTSKVMQAIYAAKIQIGDIVGADRDGNHKAKYATLAQLLQTVGPKLRTYGVIIRQGSGRLLTRESNNVGFHTLSVYTRLIHVPSGQSVVETMDIPFQKTDPQSTMSALKYGQRATLRSILGVTDGEAEDDGNGAMSRITLDGDTMMLPEAKKYIDEMRSCKDAATLKTWAVRSRDTMATLSDGAAWQCREEYQRLMRALENAKTKPKAE